MELGFVEQVDCLQIVERLKVNSKLVDVALAGSRVDPRRVQCCQVIFVHSRRHQITYIVTDCFLAPYKYSYLLTYSTADSR